LIPDSSRRGGRSPANDECGGGAGFLADRARPTSDDFNLTPSFPLGPIAGQSAYLAPPTTANGLVYAAATTLWSASLFPGYGVGAEDVFAFDAKTGDVRWSYALGEDEAVMASTVIADGRLLVSARGLAGSSRLRAFGLP